MERAVVRALFALLALLAARTADAQEAATITGRVTDTQGQPQAAVMVRIESLNVAASTAADGMYRLVVSGARIHAELGVRITAARPGLETVTHGITVSPGAVLSHDLRMAPRVVLLEDVVVNGTPGPVELSSWKCELYGVNAEDLAFPGAAAPSQESGQEPHR